MTLLAALILLCLAGSFFCSLSEAALFSISRARIETLRRQGHKSAAVLGSLRDEMDATIAAILILNTAINTGAAAWVGGLVVETFGEVWLGVFTGVFTFAASLICGALWSWQGPSVALGFASVVAAAAGLGLIFLRLPRF